MRDVSWTLIFEEDGSETTVIADWIESPTPQRTTGSEVTLEVAFAPDYFVQEPAVDRYQTLIPYLETSTNRLAFGAERGTVWFRDRVPANADIDSFLIGVEPSEETIQQPACWALITNLTDLSNPLDPVDDLYRIEMTVFILAKLDAFADHSAVRTQFEESVIS